METPSVLGLVGRKERPLLSVLGSDSATLILTLLLLPGHREVRSFVPTTLLCVHTSPGVTEPVNHGWKPLPLSQNGP